MAKPKNTSRCSGRALKPEIAGAASTHGSGRDLSREPMTELEADLQQLTEAVIRPAYARARPSVRA